MTAVLADGKDCETGVDISRYQLSSTINYQAASRCRAWMCAKVSGGDGGTYPDNQFWAHMNGAAGLFQRGGYHFLGDGNGGAQADFFVNAAGGYQSFELPPTVDMETYGSSGQYRPSQQTLRDFINEVERLVPKRWTGPTGEPVAMMVYTGKSLEPQLYPELVKYDLWLAAYLNRFYPNPQNGVTNGCSPNVAALGSPDQYIPRPWREWGVWQFAGGDGGSDFIGNGVSNCDQDVMTVETFNRLTGGTGDSGLSAQEVADINAHTDAAIAGLQAQLGTWMQQQSANVVGALAPKIDATGMQSRRFAFRIGAAPDAWLVSFDAQGATRTHIPDQATEQALVDIGAISPVLNIDVTDEAKAAALMAIREVPWRPIGT